MAVYRKMHGPPSSVCWQKFPFLVKRYYLHESVGYLPWFGVCAFSLWEKAVAYRYMGCLYDAFYFWCSFWPPLHSFSCRRSFLLRTHSSIISLLKTGTQNYPPLNAISNLVLQIISLKYIASLTLFFFSTLLQSKPTEFLSIYECQPLKTDTW